MTLILIIWITLIEAEAWRNYYLIKRDGNVNHTRQTWYRIIAGFIFWLVTMPPITGMEWDQWAAQPLMQVGTFFFLFDLSLNLMLGNPWYYFGKIARLDRIQGQWPLPAWFFKFFLMCLGTTLYFYGWSAVVTF